MKFFTHVDAIGKGGCYREGGKIIFQGISASATPMRKISTTASMFSRSTNSTELFSILCDASASHDPEIVRLSLISASAPRQLCQH